MTATSSLGVDLGGTKIAAVRLIDGVVADSVKRKTPRGATADDILDAVAATIDKLAPVNESVPVGVGVPGLVEPGSGTVTLAINLGWRSPVPVAEGLRQRLGDRAHVAIVENDVNAAVVAEHRLGAHSDLDDLLGVLIGTGIGGGVILNREIHRGASGLGGEIGHVVVRPGGRLCACGKRGHLEAYAGRAAMERAARRLAERGRSSMLVERSGSGRITSGTWGVALDAGDEVAHELLTDAGVALGTAIASASTLLGIRAVVLGGGMVEWLGNTLVDHVRAASADASLDDNAPLISTTSIGELSGAIGAALLARDVKTG